MSKHTPGPWKFHCAINDDLTHNGSVFYEECPGVAYCVCKAPRYEGEMQWKANAALIAAAPEMLEALEPFANYACDDWQTHGCHNCIAKRAIAKAKGVRK